MGEKNSISQLKFLVPYVCKIGIVAELGKLGDEGLKQGKTACCGTGKFRGVYSCGGKRAVKEFELCKNPNEYLFWDSFHLTEMAYKQLADEMWGGNGNSLAVGPYNLKQLFQNWIKFISYIFYFCKI